MKSCEKAVDRIRSEFDDGTMVNMGNDEGEVNDEKMIIK